MLGEDCNFLDVRAGGKTLHPLYFNNHPCQKLPSHLDSFYILKLSYHFYELVHSSIFDRKRMDFAEYLLHHFLTFALIAFSYVSNFLPIGAAVMILHDVTDMTVSIFKLSIDVTPTIIEVLGYLTMLITWVYFRLWFFPVHVIWRIFKELKTWDSNTYNPSLSLMLPAFLMMLFVMHVFWFYLMIKWCLRRLENMNSISL
jgi:TLC domain